MKQRLKDLWERRRQCCTVWLSLAGLVVAILAVVGTITVGRLATKKVVRWAKEKGARVSIPISKLPGPPRPWGTAEFALDPANALRMLGTDDSENERWCDVAGNFYTSEFISRFSYEDTGPDGPLVLVKIEDEAPTLRGRLEARRLKPNFAYQVKVRGLFSDKESLERIGYAGRWRLPGSSTNYKDKDYEKSLEQDKVEAYLFFDYFVTDAQGNAVREFALDSCLHVLWSATRQRKDVPVSDLVFAIVDASDPRFYARPKNALAVEALWAEHERARYETVGQKLFLPPGEYSAELVLTEEGFHSRDNDGGWWATVSRCPIEFTLTAGPEPEADSE